MPLQVRRLPHPFSSNWQGQRGVRRTGRLRRATIVLNQASGKGFVDAHGEEAPLGAVSGRWLASPGEPGGQGIGSVLRDAAQSAAPQDEDCATPTQSISMSNGPIHSGTQTKMRAGGSTGK